MKKLLYHLSVVTIACSALVSCQETLKEDAGIPQNDPDGLQLTVLASNPSVNEGVIVGTRSEITDADKVTDVNFFVFSSDTGEFVSSSYHAKNSGISAAELFIHNGYTFTDKFDVYILANMGDVHDDQYLTDLQSINDFTYCFDPEFSSFKTKGFPMSSVYKDFCPITDIPAGSTLLADRLVAELHIKFTQSANNHNGYEIVSGFIGNLTRIAQPFADDAYACPGTSNTYTEKFEGHTFDNKLVNDEVTVYALENVHGMTPLKDNFKNKQSLTDQEKCKENLLEDYQNNRITYLDITCNVTYANSGETHPNVRYRYYFGNDNKDFSVYRNTVSEVTINFDNIEVTNEGWREEDGEKYYRPEVSNETFVNAGKSWSASNFKNMELGTSDYLDASLASSKEAFNFFYQVVVKGQDGETETTYDSRYNSSYFTWYLDVTSDPEETKYSFSLPEGGVISNSDTRTKNIGGGAYYLCQEQLPSTNHFYRIKCVFSKDEPFVEGTINVTSTFYVCYYINPDPNAAIQYPYYVYTGSNTKNQTTRTGSEIIGGYNYQYTDYIYTVTVKGLKYTSSSSNTSWTVTCNQSGTYQVDGKDMVKIQFYQWNQAYGTWTKINTPIKRVFNQSGITSQAGYANGDITYQISVACNGTLPEIQGPSDLATRITDVHLIRDEKIIPITPYINLYQLWWLIEGYIIVDYEIYNKNTGVTAFTGHQKITKSGTYRFYNSKEFDIQLLSCNFKVEYNNVWPSVEEFNEVKRMRFMEILWIGNTEGYNALNPSEWELDSMGNYYFGVKINDTLIDNDIIASSYNYSSL